MLDIVVVGAGYAGVWAARAAVATLADRQPKHRPRVALLAPEPFLVARPRLYEAALPDKDARIGLLPLLSAEDIGFVPGRATSVESGKVVYVDPSGNSRSLAAKAIVVATGSQVAKPDGSHLWTIDHVHEARSFWTELRRRTECPGRPPVLIVIGGGATGLEAAAEAASMHAGRLRVKLINTCKITGWSKEARSYILRRLQLLGVALHLGQRVVSTSHAGVELEGGEVLAADLILWTAGMRPSELADSMPLRAADGRVAVDQFMRPPSTADIFWAGDVAAAPTPDTGTTIMSCQHAMQMGETAGQNAALHVAGEPLLTFTPRSYVTCLALGNADALLTEGIGRDLRHAGPDAAAIKRHIIEQLIVPTLVRAA